MKRSISLSIGIILTLCSIATALCQIPEDDEIKIIHINVGQGDATLILGPVDSLGNRVTVLMDTGDIPSGGGVDGGQIVRAVLQRENITSLDFLIISHYHADHIGGAISGQSNIHGTSFIYGPNGVPGDAGDDDGNGIIDWLDNAQIQPDPNELGHGDDIQVLNFVDRGDESNPGTIAYQKYEALAERMGRRRSLYSRYWVSRYRIDLGNGALMYCIAGNGYVRGTANQVHNANSENERSLCFLFEYRGFHYLIGGDIIGRRYGAENAEVENAIGQYLLERRINVDVLNVNHHGGNNASAAPFLNTIGPEVAIISVGNDNSHGHPHGEALTRLIDAGVSKIYQTEWGSTEDEIPEVVRRQRAIFQGDIILISDGNSYNIYTNQQFSVDN